MKSSTNNYVKMKEIYKNKFDQDLTVFKKTFFSIIDQYEKDAKIASFPIINEYLNDFLKNLKMLRFID